MLSKEKLRKKFIALRKKNYFDSEEIFFKPLINLILKKKRSKISLYYPSNFEFSTIKLFEILSRKRRNTTLLPVICQNMSMKFIKWKFYDPLQVNKFGFLEPKINQKKIIPDLILVPIVAFDKFKNRLGYGKGYYDRILRQYISKNPNIITIGLAFSFQKYKKIPTSKFDVKLNYILTEKGLY